MCVRVCIYVRERVRVRVYVCMCLCICAVRVRVWTYVCVGVPVCGVWCGRVRCASVRCACVRVRVYQRERKDCVMERNECVFASCGPLLTLASSTKSNYEFAISTMQKDLRKVSSYEREKGTRNTIQAYHHICKHRNKNYTPFCSIRT